MPKLSKQDASALDLVAPLHAPLLIIPGTEDEEVPVGWAWQFEERAREIGKDVEAIYYEGADHNFSVEPKYVTDVQGRIVTFLRRHLMS